VIVLALETSTSLGSVAIVCEKGVLAVKESHRQRSHTEFINQAIEECLVDANLQLSQIDLYAASLGPGSFTGLRVAGNVAKTFAYSFKKRIYTVDSLSLLAAQSSYPDLCVSILNAYKNMVFVAATSKTKILQRPVAMTIPEFEAFVLAISSQHSDSKVLCVGEAYTEYEAEMSEKTKMLLQRPSETNDFPNAKMLGSMAFHSHPWGQTIEWNSFIPLYIRASAAEENKRTQ
jgi:N6-L-threonylcarbamoyladenine synthase/tRNA threonylcarbamoyladenosine biosynthesis protein TsaB